MSLKRKSVDEHSKNPKGSLSTRTGLRSQSTSPNNAQTSAGKTGEKSTPSSRRQARRQKARKGEGDIDVDSTARPPNPAEIPEILSGLATVHGGAEFADALEHHFALRASFSKARYSEVAEYFELGDVRFEDWPDMDVKDITLPESVYEPYCKNMLLSFANPGPTATALFLSANFQALVSLFGGILKNHAERAIPRTDINSGGNIECEVFCRDELLVYLYALKCREKLQDTKEFEAALAQAMCEVHSAWHLNRTFNKDFPDRIPTVSACLYDALDATFISYDGKIFKKRSFTLHPFPNTAEKAEVEKYIRAAFKVHEFSFALLVNGYFSATDLYQEQSTTEGWRTALVKADEARQYFQRAHTMQDHSLADAGLERLSESLRSWPPVIVGKIKLVLPVDLKILKEDLVAAYRRESKESDRSWVPKASVSFSPTISGRKQEAVEAFWARLPWLREILEPMMKVDCFRGLSLLASDPERYKATVTEKLNEIELPLLVEELKKSKEEGLWDL